MAELSIIGFVVGSLSFVVTVRNAIERLLQDADAFKTQNDILVPLSGALDLLSIQLGIWKKFWHVHEGTPHTVFSSYWGEHGSREIKKLLAHVYKQFDKVEAEFRSEYGHIPDDLVPQERLAIPGQMAYSKDREKESLEMLTQFIKQRTSRRHRFKTALFTGSIFYRHVENLESSIRLLQDISEKRFVANVCAYGEADWKDRVDNTAAREHLTNLADHSSITSQSLRDLLKCSEDHNFDFCLDYGTSPAQRQDEVFGFARRCHMPYFLCVSPRYSPPETLAFGIECQEAKSLISIAQWDESLQQALQKLSPNNETPCSLPTYIRAADTAPGFIVSSYTLPHEDLENLRTYMVSTKSEFDQNLHGEFSRLDRVKLAYELAECALLFLRTEWFSEICSCCIYRHESVDLKTKFTVRVNTLGHADHIDPESGESSRLTKWCEQELRSMHIRRLGVLLTEIAVGSPIFEVAFNDIENEVEIDFEVDVDEPRTTQAARFKDILRRVRREGSEDFMDAIGYCLKQGTMPREVAQTDLKSFYDHVVEPLFLHYNEEIIKPAIRRQRRKLAREAGAHRQVTRVSKP